MNMESCSVRSLVNKAAPYNLMISKRLFMFVIKKKKSLLAVDFNA